MQVLNTTACLKLVTGDGEVARGLQPTIKRWETLLLVLGFGTFTTFVALLFVCIRKRAYRDKVWLIVFFVKNSYMAKVSRTIRFTKSYIFYSEKA